MNWIRAYIVYVLPSIAITAVFFGLAFMPAVNPIPQSELKIESRWSVAEGTVPAGDTLSALFERHAFTRAEMQGVLDASKSAYDLTRIVPGRPYRARVERATGLIDEFYYEIDDAEFVRVMRVAGGFRAVRGLIPYERVVAHIGGAIDSSLVESMDSLALAIQLSDVLAWDIDFTSDIRNGDTYKVVVEELRRDGKFVRYGEILSAEFVNNGRRIDAYRYSVNNTPGYYDHEGNALRRPFLRAPLSYRRISSGFTSARMHPVLRIVRPHYGIDYAASPGTPVSSVGDGVIEFAGYKGQNGNHVVIRHTNGYKTYYGHLQKISRGIRPGARVGQGDVIGTVGSTGLATGPHLDYRMSKNGRFLNPLKVAVPAGNPVPKALLADYMKAIGVMDTELAGIETRRKG